ncbi:addiction module component CHP02574 family protein [Flavobacterium sp. ZT3R18]|uniref:addiction module component CHP02574 family protein n=1 Tax=Flavobacterium sp. ZT3R18 TaxID=2594429 RepID=UPI00117AFF40|nr:addiction module component CHP02574 family protein [Flavobacterium sp. ZT3R18]TRX36775.1 addiction module component CHP02574 family protein [Flavobacterium sp. ZT3R18]
MKLQVLQDNFGNQTGVYVPMEDWTLIKNNYPDIENLEQDLLQWEKDLIDSRLEAIAINPERLKPIEGLLEELKRKI